MGTGPISGSGDVPAALAGALRVLVPGYPEARLCVALSGGVDSVALLHAAGRLAGDEPRLALRAMHVDHGLQPESRTWARRCEALCTDLGLPLVVLRLRLAIGRGASVEAEARSARYAALAQALEPGECLLTAHHADDQLETLLLQLFRGAGVKGLAAMPRSAPLGCGLHLRPLLGLERRDLQSYVRAAGLDWVDDPMNASSRFDRAFLRHEVLPAIRRRWPAVARTASRSARHCGAAQGLLDTLAAADLAPLLDTPGRLDIAGLDRLARDRQVNVLRYWIAGRGLGLPSSARLAAILDDVLPARDDAQPRVGWATGEVRRYRGRLYALSPLGPPPPAGWEQSIRPGERVELPCGLGRVALEPAVGEGMAIDPGPEPLTLSFRSGGLRLQPAGRDAAHRLKNLFQEAGIVPWMRNRLPLLRRADALLAVADLWVGDGHAAVAGRPAAVLSWQDGPAVR